MRSYPRGWWIIVDESAELYYVGSGLWTDDVRNAARFGTSDDAINAANGLDGAFTIVLF